MSQIRGDEPNLELGDSGEGVYELQFRLYRLGHYREFPDGTYDMRTENAVRDLQVTLGQDNTGMVTHMTWEAIVYWEQYHGLEYQYTSPSYAIDQLRYDLDQAALQHQDNQARDGQWHWTGTEWVGGDAAHSTAQLGQVSEDGRWQWNGYEWVAATNPQSAGGHAEAPAGGHTVGSFSEDGHWRWDGSNWVATTPADHVGRLSPDGYWRWDGRDWVVA